MNSKVLKTLEYEKIIDQLVNCAGSLLGKELCRHLVPSSDIEEIRTMQHETSLALARIYQKGSLSFSYFSSSSCNSLFSFKTAIGSINNVEPVEDWSWIIPCT